MKAPALLLIHGFPLDHTIWDKNIEALSEVTEVLAPDLRGFGGSSTTDATTPMETFASDLMKLLDQRGLRQVIPCGLSMGGYIAMALAELAPERVAGLILCNTRSLADTEEAREGRRNTANDARTKGMHVIARAMAPKVLGTTTRSTHPEMVAHIEAMIAGQGAHGTAAASLGMAERPDRTAVLRNFHKPTLVITGDEDELMPLPTSKAMAEALPNAQLVILDKAGHLSNMEQPAAFNAAVIHFLRSHFS